MTLATDFTVLLSFEDQILSNLVSALLSHRLPDLSVVNHNEVLGESDGNIIRLTDTPHAISDNDLYILFSGQGQGTSLRQIVVPFRAGQLIDNLSRLMRGSNHYWPEEHIPIGPYKLSMQDGLLEKGGGSNDPLYLTEKERDILYFLHKAEGKPVDRKNLLNFVWQYAENVETHTLETHIYRLRQKIEKDPAVPEILLKDEKGYRLCGPFYPE